MNRLTVLLAAVALATSLSAHADVREPVRYRQLHVSPGVGEYTIARVRGPGVFVAASVVGMGINLAQVGVYVDIDDRTVFQSGLGSADAALGAQTNSGVGVTYAPDLGGRARASFGVAEPLQFERELRVYVRVEAGTPSRVFGDVLVGATD